MKNTRLALFLDSFLTLFIAFFCTLILSYALKVKHLYRIILSFVFSLCLSGIVFIAKLRKRRAYLISQKDKKSLEILLANLEIMPDNEVIALLFNFLTFAGVKVEKRKNYLFSSDTVYLFNYEKNTSRGAFCNKIKEHKNKKIIFFCNSLSEEATALFLSLKNRVKVINGERLFALFKKYGYDFKQEESQRITTTPFLRFKKFKEKVFTKKRALGFAFSSATLLLFSRWTFYPIYYRICALILISTAILCLIFGKKQTEDTESPLSF